MIVIFPRNGQRIEISNGAAVRHGTLPVTPEHQAAREPAAATLEVLSVTGAVLAVFRSKQLAGSIVRIPWDT